jgi:two-component system OmpR family sensor kinase/two-component system phosphate regulon sensor histidine kinase PhoR
MKSISGYRKKQIIYLSIIFTLFMALVIILEYHREKRYRSNALNKELDSYTILINSYINSFLKDEISFTSALDSFIRIFPDKHTRITVIRPDGAVMYDSEVKNTSEMENHLMRPEIQEALTDTTGSDIRISASTGIKYYYFARRFGDYFIRMSVVYDVEARQVIEPDKLPLLSIVLLFFITSLTLIYITDKFGESVAALRKFTLKALADKPIDEDLSFPESELGIIGKDIVGIYRKLNSSRHELQSEKEKLIRHLNLLDEGSAIFSKDKKVITSNSHFIQYINHISDELVYSAENFFSIQDFAPLFSFIDAFTRVENPEPGSQPSYEITIYKDRKYYNARCILFQDRSFEINIRDITKPAKRKLIKQQMTENIAHELKTPVSSIKGLLETVVNSKIEKTQRKDFIRRAYAQTCRLADLIDDISLLTNIEEAGHLYPIEKVNLNQVINNILNDLQGKISEHHIRTEVNIPENVELTGNPVLLYSIFRNLLENAINYAGDNITVRIDKYMEDPQNYYFSFSDSGTGVPDQDIPRLFERFYRVDKSRDRKSGGTGLGLSIVKNAVLFHKGEISVKNRKGGGLEFFFSLYRDLE